MPIELSLEEWKRFEEIDARPITDEERASALEAYETFKTISLNSMKHERGKLRALLSDWHMSDNLTETELESIIDNIIIIIKSWDRYDKDKT